MGFVEILLRAWLGLDPDHMSNAHLALLGARRELGFPISTDWDYMVIQTCWALAFWGPGPSLGKDPQPSLSGPQTFLRMSRSSPCRETPCARAACRPPEEAFLAP